MQVMDKLTLSINHDISGKSGTGPATPVAPQISSVLDQNRALTLNLMEQVCERANLNRAYKRVKANNGAPGVDGLTVYELEAHIVAHKAAIVTSLLAGTYKPQPVRVVEIPKVSGGVRQLGIPTVLDRLIQQAILQVLEPILDPSFSSSSFGFRPGKSAHQALKRAQEYVKDDYGIVVDIDLASFFDSVNHDILMSRMARRIEDKRLLRLLRKFLQAGMMIEGVVTEREQGTPQGSPLSPLLSNVMLDELDQELERRGHKFCRYADDCNIYVRSLASGERVMSSIARFLYKRLKLRVNQEKSGVAPVCERKFLGYRLLPDGGLGIARESIKRVKSRIRQLTVRSRGIDLQSVIRDLNEYLTGWLNYFRFADLKRQLSDLDGWLRRKLRCYRLKQRKRSYPIAKFLISLGVPVERAWTTALSSKGWWRLSATPAVHEALSNAWFGEQGLINLSKRYNALQN
jgi:RNA-directed DNA polymerase